MLRSLGCGRWRVSWAACSLAGRRRRRRRRLLRLRRRRRRRRQHSAGYTVGGIAQRRETQWVWSGLCEHLPAGLSTFSGCAKRPSHRQHPAYSHEPRRRGAQAILVSQYAPPRRCMPSKPHPASLHPQTRACDSYYSLCASRAARLRRALLCSLPLVPRLSARPETPCLRCVAMFDMARVPHVESRTCSQTCSRTSILYRHRHTVMPALLNQPPSSASMPGRLHAMHMCHVCMQRHVAVAAFPRCLLPRRRPCAKPHRAVPWYASHSLPRSTTVDPVGMP